MNKTHMTYRQFSALILLSLLSPLMRVLPRSAVVSAGKEAWISALLAGALLFLFSVPVLSAGRNIPAEDSLADALLHWLGPVFGRAVLVIYGIWLLFYAGFILHSGAERLVTAVYPKTPLYLFETATALVCLLLSLGNMRAIGRTGVMLLGILLGFFGIILLFGISEISPENIFPVSPDFSVLPGAFPTVTVGGVAVFFAFLRNYTSPPVRRIRFLLPVLLIFAAVAAVLCLEVVGTFGAKLTLHLNYPFFVMVRDISFLNVAQRIEAAVIVMWLFADIILCVCMLRGSHEIFRTVFSLPCPDGMPLFSVKNGRWLLFPETGISLLCSILLPVSSFSLSLWSEKIVPLVTDGLVFLGLPLFYCIGKLRKKD